MHFLCLPERYMPSPSHNPWFDGANSTIIWRGRIIKLLVKQISPSFSYIVQISSPQSLPIYEEFHLPGHCSQLNEQTVDYKLSICLWYVACIDRSTWQWSAPFTSRAPKSFTDWRCMRVFCLWTILPRFVLFSTHGQYFLKIFYLVWFRVHFNWINRKIT